jgi:hypothetical protein
LSRKGGGSPGSVGTNVPVHRSHDCRRSWRDRRPNTSRGLRSTQRSTPVRRVHRLLSGENRDIPSTHASNSLVPLLGRLAHGVGVHLWASLRRRHL